MQEKQSHFSPDTFNHHFLALSAWSCFDQRIKPNQFTQEQHAVTQLFCPLSKITPNSPNNQLLYLNVVAIHFYFPFGLCFILSLLWHFPYFITSLTIPYLIFPNFLSLSQCTQYILHRSLHGPPHDYNLIIKFIIHNSQLSSKTNTFQHQLRNTSLLQNMA